MNMLKHFHVTEKVLKAYYGVYNELGHGFLESVYQRAFVIAARDLGLEVQDQVPIPVFFRGHQVGDFRADLFVDSVVLVELKTVRTLEAAHLAQIMNYLKATNVELGMLLNFGPKPEFKRVVLESARKNIRVNPRKSAVALGQEVNSFEVI
jgi:GxxExxY protein